MSLFTKDQYEEIDKNLDKIKEKIKEKQLEFFEPTKKEILSVTAVLLGYIKAHKRIIYGGYALDVLLKNKNPLDGIYTEKDLPDIDFYSVEPIKDLIGICDLLKQKGFKRIQGKEALHKETYKIHVNLHEYCDITYVPTIINNNMPVIEVDGISYIDPQFMLVDYYRMLNDPLTSFWRIDKFLPRLEKLQKNYKTPLIKEQLENTEVKNNKLINKINEEIIKYCSDNKNLIMIGLYGYNYLLVESGYKKFKPLNLSYLEIISDNYAKDGLKIKDIFEDVLKSETATEKFELVEFHPYFQFVDNTAYYTLDGTVVLKLYRNNGRCFTYKEVPIIPDFTDIKKQKDTINIGSIDLMLMFSLMNYNIYLTRMGIPDEREISEHNKNYYLTMYSNLLEMRNYFYEKNNISLLDDNSIFQEFIISCIGKTIPLEMESILRIEKNIEKKKPPKFSYTPTETPLAELPNYNFANISGNRISNPKNYKITKEKLEEKEKKEKSNEN